MRVDRILDKLGQIAENIELISQNMQGSVEEFKSLGLVKDGIYKKARTLNWACIRYM